MNPTIFLVIIIGFFLTNCSDNKTSSDKWYESTKSEILKQSDLKEDSSTVSFMEDYNLKKEYYYSEGHKFLEKWYIKGVLRAEIHYSNNGEFELRREIYDDGIYAFEGVIYKSTCYGLSTWYYCDGKVDHQGIRYHDQKVGVWKKFDETGKLTEEIDYKNIEKLDSMPIISR